MMVSGIANIKIFITVNAWKAMKFLADFLFNHPKHKHNYATRNYVHSMNVLGFIDMHLMKHHTFMKIYFFHRMIFLLLIDEFISYVFLLKLE